MNNPEAANSLDNPIVTLLTDEDDGNLSADDLSLREAILYSGDGDTISFDPSLQDETISLTQGEIRIDKNLTIQGFEDNDITIDAGNLSRIFLISDRSRNLTDVTLNNLTLTGGNAGNSHGGAIANVEKLTINNSLITANSGSEGGAIYNNSTDGLRSQVVLNDSEVSNNSAVNGGGGIFINSDSFGGNLVPDALVVRNSVISGNTSTDWHGGGVLAYPSIAIIDSAIEQNESKYSGGGIFNRASTTILNSTIDGNKASSGGGISSYYVEIDGSTISNNEAIDGGGGISIGGFEGSLAVSNSTISSNTAGTEGGGISQDIAYGSGTISNTTITNNSAPVGGGIKQDDFGFSSLRVTSSIVADNADNNDIDASGVISGGNNLIGNGENTGSFIDRINGDLVGTADEPVDPNLGDLQDNGGATFTHALLPESPAINRGSNLEELATDQRGESFERVLFDTADIGAYEADTDAPDNLPVLPPEPIERIVTTLDDETDGNFDAGDLSLREALAIANSGDTITFDPSLSGNTIILNSGELTIDTDLTVRGLGADNLTIDANNLSRVFNVDNGANTTIQAKIEGLTITGGNAVEQGGGGINNQESLTVNEVKITGNTADFGGGGILTNDFANTTINNSTISGNSATSNGGAISNYSATTTVNNSTISGNSADSRGGGISSISFYGGSVTVNNSTISGNSAARYGGGIDGFDSSVDINNSTITDNSAPEGGSGVSLDFASGKVTSSIIAGNRESDDFFGLGTSGGNNLIGSNPETEFADAVFVDGVKEDIVGTTDNPLDPRLEELQDNDGMTLTHALLSDSRAIDAGSNSLELTTDQRGIERSIRQTDIGALESQAGIVVNEIEGSDGDDIISASNNDIVRGGNGKDVIFTLEGDDTLLGGQQFDRLNGGAGDDVLDGEQGIEVLTGGTGSDLFYLNDMDNIAWVTDFELDRDSLGLAQGIAYSDLEITGEVNSFISYEGDRFAVLLGVNSADLNGSAFMTV